MNIFWHDFSVKRMFDGKALLSTEKYISYFQLLCLCCCFAMLFSNLRTIWELDKGGSLVGMVYVNLDGHEWKRAKLLLPIRNCQKFSDKLMTSYVDLMICDSVNNDRLLNCWIAGRTLEKIRVSGLQEHRSGG